MTLTKPQRQALFDLYQRNTLTFDGTFFRASEQGTITYRQFRTKVIHAWDNCAIIPWCGMWIGIEADGYTHS